MADRYEFDVALSFAGPDREHARIIGRVAQANGLRAFVDEFHIWETWGRSLVDFRIPS
jgi:hypothetical protein